MIQGVINRLAGNSSAYKGWMVTITAALLGVAINNHKPVLAWLGVYIEHYSKPHVIEKKKRPRAAPNASW